MGSMAGVQEQEAARVREQQQYIALAHAARREAEGGGE